MSRFAAVLRTVSLGSLALGGWVGVGAAELPAQDPARDLPWQRIQPRPSATQSQQLALRRLAAGWNWEAMRAIRELQAHRQEAAFPHLLFALAARSEPNRAARHCFDATQRLASASAAERVVIEAYRDYFGVTEQPELIDPRFAAQPPSTRWQQLRRALANQASLAGNQLAVELLAVEAAWSRKEAQTPPAASVRHIETVAANARANGYLAQRGAMPFVLPRYRAIREAAIKRIGQPLRLDRLPRHPAYPEDQQVAYYDLLELMAVAAPVVDTGQSHWQPRIAPDYKLSRGLGGTAERAALRGKPHLVVFFLGFGCAHCVAQLADLDPMAAKFRDAGIEVVSIGTDSVVQVRAAHQAAIENGVDPLHFDVLCDPAGTAFKSFGCWDEFAGEALHGTFLVDGEDRILWQDVSLRPFEDSKWLLAECQRLLAAWRDE